MSSTTPAAATPVRRVSTVSLASSSTATALQPLRRVRRHRRPRLWRRLPQPVERRGEHDVRRDRHPLRHRRAPFRQHHRLTGPALLGHRRHRRAPLRPVDVRPDRHPPSGQASSWRGLSGNFDTSEANVTPNGVGPAPGNGAIGGGTGQNGFATQAFATGFDHVASGQTGIDDIGPYGEAFGPDGDLYVIDLPDVELFKFDSTGGTTSGHLVGTGPIFTDGSVIQGIAFSASGRLYATGEQAAVQHRVDRRAQPVDRCGDPPGHRPRELHRPARPRVRPGVRRPVRFRGRGPLLADHPHRGRRDTR